VRSSQKAPHETFAGHTLHAVSKEAFRYPAAGWLRILKSTNKPSLAYCALISEGVKHLERVKV
jgi:hypothetical protein